MLAMWYTVNARMLKPLQVQDFAFHLARVPITPPLQASHLPLWMVISQAPLNNCFQQVIKIF